MRQRELVQAIDLAFEEAGQKGDWIHRSFKSLYELNQLAHFRIFDINWFNGAAQILELVDQLHSLQTSKEDFLQIAEMLGIEISSRLSKKEMAKVVKANPSWRVKCFELESRKKMDQRKETLRPLFDHMASLGYRTDLLPRQVSFRRWMVDAVNRDGAKETIYLNENESGDLVLIQSTNQDFIDMFRMETNLFATHV